MTSRERFNQIYELLTLGWSTRASLKIGIERTRLSSGSKTGVTVIMTTAGAQVDIFSALR